MELEMGEALCGLLAAALHGEKPGKMPQKEELNVLLNAADRHSVLPLLYGVVCGEECKGAELAGWVQEKSRRTVQQNYHLLFQTRFVVGALAECGIPAIVLKGCSAAVYYPVPELRKAGDVDLLLENKESVDRACRCLEKFGYHLTEEQHANHHLVCVSPDGIAVELHLSLAEPFDVQRINRWLEDCRADFFRHYHEEELLGISLPVPERPYLAFYLLLHMLQHFLRSGFGLKLLCDWTVFWEQDCQPEEQQTFLRLIRESATGGFCVTVTAFCVRYLGLAAEKVEFLLIDSGTKAVKPEEFLKEILEAEEFGKSSRERMVALRGSRLSDYVREFHHQTMLTYPQASGCPALFPVYWVKMLAGFLYRNRKLRGVRSMEVLKKAAKRGRLVDKMRIFEEE